MINPILVESNVCVNYGHFFQSTVNAPGHKANLDPLVITLSDQGTPGISLEKKRDKHRDEEGSSSEWAYSSQGPGETSTKVFPQAPTRPRIP